MTDHIEQMPEDRKQMLDDREQRKVGFLLQAVALTHIKMENLEG